MDLATGMALGMSLNNTSTESGDWFIFVLAGFTFIWILSWSLTVVVFIKNKKFSRWDFDFYNGMPATLFMCLDIFVCGIWTMIGISLLGEYILSFF